MTTLFLDVDGVLSPIRGPSSAWDDWESMPFNRYSLHLSRAMAARIAALSVKIVWLTTWRQLANSQIGAWLDWPIHDVAEPSDDAPDSRLWKVSVVRAHIESGQGPLVWIDDDLPAMAPHLGELLTPNQRLLVAPNPDVGLTSDDLDRVEAFLATIGYRH